MTQDEYRAIAHEGRAAFLSGSDRSDNPFFKWQMMPVHTGESLEAWREKCDAWISGFTAARDEAGRDTKTRHAG